MEYHSICSRNNLDVVIMTTFRRLAPDLDLIIPGIACNAGNGHLPLM